MSQERPASPASRPVVVCADDFGISDGVSKGILKLVEARRLSATGVMANGKAGRWAAKELRRHARKVGIGLHLNLTCGEPLTAMPGFAPSGTLPQVRDVIVAAATGRLPLAEIAAEAGRQIDVHMQAYGRAPDFVDGHQHVHVLPGIRGVVIDLVARRCGANTWLRDPSDAFSAIMSRPAPRKAVVVSGLARGFREAARKAGLRTNVGFSGFSAFDENAALDLAGAFDRLGAGHLVMCHPGHADDVLASLDPVTASRDVELSFLLSDDYAALLARVGVVLVPRPATCA